MTEEEAEVGEAGDDERCDMPSDIDVELDVPPLAPEPLHVPRSVALDTGALYVHTILRDTQLSLAQQMDHTVQF